MAPRQNPNGMTQSDEDSVGLGSDGVRQRGAKEEKKRIECNNHGAWKLKNRAKASYNQPVANQILVLIIAASFGTP